MNENLEKGDGNHKNCEPLDITIAAVRGERNIYETRRRARLTMVPSKGEIAKTLALCTKNK